MASEHPGSGWQPARLAVPAGQAAVLLVIGWRPSRIRTCAHGFEAAAAIKRVCALYLPSRGPRRRSQSRSFRVFSGSRRLPPPGPDGQVLDEPWRDRRLNGPRRPGWHSSGTRRRLAASDRYEETALPTRQGMGRDNRPGPHGSEYRCVQQLAAKPSIADPARIQGSLRTPRCPRDGPEGAGNYLPRRL